MRHCDCADVRLAVDHRLLCALHMLPVRGVVSHAPPMHKPQVNARFKNAPRHAQGPADHSRPPHR